MKTYGRGAYLCSVMGRFNGNTETRRIYLGAGVAAPNVSIASRNASSCAAQA